MPPVLAPRARSHVSYHSRSSGRADPASESVEDIQLEEVSISDSTDGTEPQVVACITACDESFEQLKVKNSRVVAQSPLPVGCVLQKLRMKIQRVLGAVEVVLH